MEFNTFSSAMWGNSGRNIMDISKDGYTSDNELYEKMIEIIGQDRNMVIIDNDRYNLLAEESTTYDIKKEHQIDVAYFNSFEWYVMYFIFEKNDETYKIKYQKTCGDAPPFFHFIEHTKKILNGESDHIPPRELGSTFAPSLVNMPEYENMEPLDEESLDKAMESIISMTSSKNNIKSYTDIIRCQLELLDNINRPSRIHLNKILENIQERKFDESNSVFSIRGLYITIFYIKELYTRNMITRDDITTEKIQEKIKQLLEQSIPLNARLLAESLLNENI